MFTERQVEDIVELLSTLNQDTRVYFGCDSVRFIKEGKKFARYATVCVIHKNGNKGCKIFSNHTVESDFDVKPGRPKMRMLNEVRKVCELYTQLAPLIDEFPIEIHLDINRDPQHGSSCAANEASGYVLGMTGIEPKFKPESFAASFGADGIAHGKGAIH
jgi:predicted RNase H-related nuclease YkuK (DUF458 family)